MIATGDAVQLRNANDGFLTNPATGQPWVYNVSAVEGDRLQVWHNGRNTWFAVADAERVHSLASPNDCYWTGVHTSCRHSEVTR
jgi:hypothetical protein